MYPEAGCALTYSNAYTLLVAVVLSAQSTDVGVNKVTPALFQRADTPQKMLTLSVKEVEEYIRTLGLYHRKAAHIWSLSAILVSHYGGEVPSTGPELEALPGVGRKTANVVRNVYFRHPTIPVDTHIFRVAKRLGWSTKSTPLGVEHDLEACVPEIWKKDVHALLIHHGRSVCKARNPGCSTCLVRPHCEFLRLSKNPQIN